ncbi:MAG: 5-deoxy-glucuronate isomerase [Planctomycetaceae bacterium]|nr:5-deoxy-glucuronate isomerase [Planctomycetaceae bacterium]
MAQDLLSKCSAPGSDGCIQKITPANAGWHYVGFEAYLLKPGMTLTEDTGSDEVCLVFVAGKGSVKTKDGTFEHIGQRMCPFERTKPYSVYVPPNNSFTVTPDTDLELAVCKAPATGKYPSRLIGPDAVNSVNRGKGRNTRFVQNILDDEAVAESLLVVEVFTDEGNTSSYPSHKHDTDNIPNETYLEETYYHRFDPPQGWAMQRIYDDSRSIDECVAPYDKDVVKAPKGYHPVATLAGYDNYYLNVMAGPTKMWRFTWEKDHEWINSDAYPRSK